MQTPIQNNKLASPLHAYLCPNERLPPPTSRILKLVTSTYKPYQTEAPSFSIQKPFMHVSKLKTKLTTHSPSIQRSFMHASKLKQSSRHIHLATLILIQRQSHFHAKIKHLPSNSRLNTFMPCKLKLDKTPCKDKQRHKRKALMQRPNKDIILG